MMMDMGGSNRRRVAICFSCDEAFVGFAKGLVLSLRERLTARHDLFFVDLGIGPGSRTWLEDHGVHIVPFNAESFYPGFRSRGIPDYIGALVCRPLLRELIPGYDTYMWLDADVWLQDERTITAFLAASEAEPGKIAIATTEPSAYGFSRAQVEEFSGFSDIWYSSLFGGAVAGTYRDRKILNAGVFALSATSRIWDRWGAEVSRFFGKPHHTSAAWLLHMGEQTALNYVCYAHDCFVEFNSFHNYNCHLAPVERVNGIVRRRDDTQNSIGIVHLTVSSKHGARYLREGLLYDEGRYLTDAEKQSILSLNHNS